MSFQIENFTLLHSMFVLYICAFLANVCSNTTLSSAYVVSQLIRYARECPT